MVAPSAHRSQEAANEGTSANHLHTVDSLVNGSHAAALACCHVKDFQSGLGAYKKKRNHLTKAFKSIYLAVEASPAHGPHEAAPPSPCQVSYYLVVPEGDLAADREGDLAADREGDLAAARRLPRPKRLLPFCGIRTDGACHPPSGRHRVCGELTARWQVGELPLLPVIGHF